MYKNDIVFKLDITKDCWKENLHLSDLKKGDTFIFFGPVNKIPRDNKGNAILEAKSDPYQINGEWYIDV